MKVIGFCGLPGSGKSTAINAIKYLGKIINMGDIVRNEARIRNIEATDENLGKIAKEIRKKEGDGIIAKKCVNLIKKLDAEIIFIDGIRSLAEVKVFRSYWKFPLIEIVTKDEIRHKRISDRARNDDSTTLNEIIERDKREIGFGIEKVLNEANYKIQNDLTKEILERRTKEVVLNIIETY